MQNQNAGQNCNPRFGAVSALQLPLWKSRSLTQRWNPWLFHHLQQSHPVIWKQGDIMLFFQDLGGKSKAMNDSSVPECPC